MPHRPPFYKRHFWGLVAAATLVVSYFLTAFTPFSVFIVFLPLGLGVAWWRNNKDQ